MVEKFIWGHSRRFNSYTEYFKKSFGSRVQKLTIDGGFTCPNRDGTKGTGGCTFCNNDAFNPSYCTSVKSVSQQLEEGIGFHRIRYRRVNNYLAYFQAFSNTYASLEELKPLYEEALAYPEVIGLVIGTRPDCVNEEILDYLQELNKKAYVIVEYGIESCYDKTLKRINRGHDFNDSVKAILETNKRGIRTGGHMIIGLPDESREEILKEAEILSRLPLNNLKFHQLQVVKGTALSVDYQINPHKYKQYTLDEYLQLMLEFIEKLNPSIVIERIAGETVPEYNLRPSWGLRYDQILKQFEALLERNNTWQGKKWKS
jgi:radical SAM protein (TIGR01212 family)